MHISFIGGDEMNFLIELVFCVWVLDKIYNFYTNVKLGIKKMVSVPHSFKFYKCNILVLLI